MTASPPTKAPDAAPKYVCVASVPLSRTQEELAKWAGEAYRDSPKLLLDTLKQLATLDLALIAASVVALKDSPPVVRALSLVLLLVSLAVGMVGSMPATEYGSDDIDELDALRSRVIARRRRFIRWTAGTLFAGVAVIAAGHVVAAF